MLLLCFELSWVIPNLQLSALIGGGGGERAAERVAVIVTSFSTV